MRNTRVANAIIDALGSLRDVRAIPVLITAYEVGGGICGTNAVFTIYRIMSGESQFGEGFMTDDQAKEIVSAARALVSTMDSE